ncbi:predicted signal-transduction protein containing cAMP-binding and CBS domains [Vibrio astriarenae]|nr:predicted signal-transduction protein containing cAMP-binding and CBS domains [Vibrio sp. C7]
MGSSITPNIRDFLTRLDPFDKLPIPLVEALSNSVVVKYLAQDEVITFSALCTKRYLYIVRTGAIEQRSQDGSLRAVWGLMISLALRFSIRWKSRRWI